jgi:hypothetical protein
MRYVLSIADFIVERAPHYAQLSSELYRLVQMPGSHEVMFTNLDGLAAKLVEAGRD